MELSVTNENRNRHPGPVLLACFALLGNQATLAADGTTIGQLAESMQPGNWTELNTIGAHAAFSASNSIFEYADEMVYDPVTKRVFFAGTSDPTTNERFIEYRASDNTWVTLPQPPWMGGIKHSYKHHALDIQNRQLYYRPMGANSRSFFQVNIDNIDAGWKQLADISDIPYMQDASAIDYFPERGTVVAYSGDVKSQQYGGLTEYSPGSDSWTAIPGQFSPAGELHSVLQCNPIAKACWFGGGDLSNQMWRLNADGTTDALGAVPVKNIATNKGTIITLDPVSGDFLVLTDDEEFWKFNLATDTWTQLPGGSSVPLFIGYPTSGQATFHAVAAPLSTYGVIMVAQWRPGGNSKVWLYKHQVAGNVDVISPSSPTNVQSQ